ncbi:asparaginase [Massilia sp. R2A-15]|uniref:asparaginase n=1 Tax=Massilia sp. R2A-15 TaxID=3064278 RepID=UPI002734EC92|nr:asparaginase [Massilia sp. R2A-15]WLI90039.1 asparaginase [Massilia sp. R2A-15]
MKLVPLVETTRGFPSTGYSAENVHLGSVAVVDTEGRLQWWAGDPDFMTFTRSAIKPFQALPFLLADGPARFALTPSEVALLCASHSGEPKHIAAVTSILARIGLAESDLECGCHLPLYYDSVGQPAPDRRWSQLHHNCSGKHSGFLAWCRLHDQPVAGYVDPAHPLQQAIRATLAATAGVDARAMPAGLDGCSAPNYALPLSRLAHLFARLAQGRSDPRLGAPLGDLFDAMTAHPDLVSGEARCDLAYMTAGAGEWVTKVGADAVQTIGVRSAGLGIAIKIADGAARSLQCATYSVLDQLGLLDARQRAMLEHYREPELKNVRGAKAGTIRPVFTLQRAR